MLYMDLHAVIIPGYLFSHRPWPIHLLEGGEKYYSRSTSPFCLFLTIFCTVAICIVFSLELFQDIRGLCNLMTASVTLGSTSERTISNGIALDPPIVPLTYHGSADNEKPHSLYRDVESTSLSGQDISYPEGGKGWLVVFGSFCGMLAALGLMNSIGSFDYLH